MQHTFVLDRDSKLLVYAIRPMRVEKPEKPDEKEEESMFHACIHTGFRGL